VTKGSRDGEVIAIEVDVEDGWRTTANLCRPELILPDGVGLATWELDPDAPRPGPQTSVLRVLVTERTCASGQGPQGRIVGPAVLASSERVYIVFGVRPLIATPQPLP